MSNEIKKYIRANWSTYTREAITAELLKQGFSEKEINKAWVSVDPTPPYDEMGLYRQWDFWLYLFSFMLGLPIVAALLSTIFYSYNNWFASLVVLVLIVIGAYIIGFVFFFLMRRIKPAATTGLMFGMILSVALPFIPYFIIAGICSVTTRGR